MRVLLQILLPFLLPFLAYFLWLVVTNIGRSRRGEAVLRFGQVPYGRLVLAGIVLAIVSVLAFGLYGDDESRPGGIYVPPRMENGRVIPGQMLPR